MAKEFRVDVEFNNNITASTGNTYLGSASMIGVSSPGLIATQSWVQSQGYGGATASVQYANDSASLGGVISSSYAKLSGAAFTGNLTASIGTTTLGTTNVTNLNANNTYFYKTTGPLTQWNTSGNNATYLYLDGAANFYKAIIFTTASSNRWSIGSDTVAEGGTSSGANFIIQGANNDNTISTNWLTIYRDTGLTKLAGAASIVGNLNVLGTINPSIGTTTLPPLDFASGTYVTSPAGGEMEYDGNTLSFVPNSSASGGRGIVATPIFVTIPNFASTPLANVNSAQRIFPANSSAIYLPRDTTYEMEMSLLVFTAGATSHSTGIGFNGGTIGYVTNGLSYSVIASQTTTASAAAAASTTTAAQMLAVTSSANNTILAAAASAHYKRIFVKGLVRTATTGTFIPTLTFSAQPGATGLVLSNSYLKLTPLGTSSVAATSGWF